jgi:hypothetical protein
MKLQNRMTFQTMVLRVIEISKGKKSSCFAATELFMPWIVFAPIKESLETDYRELMWAPWVSVRLEEWRGRRL